MCARMLKYTITTERERDTQGLQMKRRKKKSDISASGLRRLAMRGGVRRILKKIMPHLKIYMRLFLEQVHLSVSLVFFFLLLGCERRYCLC